MDILRLLLSYLKYRSVRELSALLQFSLLMRGYPKVCNVSPQEEISSREMATTQIIHFSAGPSIDAHGSQKTFDDMTQKAVKAFQGAKTPQHFVLGKQIQDKTAVQITSEWDGVQDYETLSTTPDFKSFVGSVRSLYGEPQNVFHVALDRSALGPDGPATANTVEYVQNYFPASRVTPTFQKQIEDDFLRFGEIFLKGATRPKARAFGWVLEEQEHEDIKDEKAKCFVVIQGWESMGDFEQSVKTDAFKEAMPIFLGWKAPFTMVGVCSAVKAVSSD